MSFWSNPGRSVRRAFRNPAKAINNQIVKPLGKVIANPADAFLPQNFRDSSFYRNVGKPLVKTGSGIGLGFITGGIPGAIAGGVSSIGSGSLTSRGFNPISNIVMPTASGLAAGYQADTGLFAPGEVFGGEAASSAVSGAVQGATQGETQGVANAGTGQAVNLAAPAAADLAPGALVDTAAGQAVDQTLFQQVKSTAINAITGGKDSTWLDMVINHGQTALNLYQGVTGLQASNKERQYAEQARQAALTGNQNALNFALQELTREMNLRKGAALASMGANGFITRRGSGGTMLDVIDGAINSNENLRGQVLRLNAQKNVNQIQGQTQAALANAERTRQGAFGNLANGGLRLFGAIR